MTAETQTAAPTKSSELIGKVTSAKMEKTIVVEVTRLVQHPKYRRVIRIFPDKPFTKKPAETRMGKGKGAPEKWVAVVKPGRVMFEMAGIDEAVAREALGLAAHKLPIPTKFVSRRGGF